jgi:hypothetical protein
MWMSRNTSENLHRLKARLDQLIEIVRAYADGNESLKHLVKIYPSLTLSDHVPLGLHDSVAYTENKKSLHFCVREHDGKMVDENALMYVAIHELAHCALSEYDPLDQNGHTVHSVEFNTVANLLYQIAIRNGLLDTIHLENAIYCGKRLIINN